MLYYAFLQVREERKLNFKIRGKQKAEVAAKDPPFLLLETVK
jgi:hypothetical protein